jgi:hypothetical protein
MTSPTPSFPGIDGSGGFIGYTPWIVLISAGLMGAANIRTTICKHCINIINVLQNRQ